MKQPFQTKAMKTAKAPTGPRGKAPKLTTFSIKKTKAPMKSTGKSHVALTKHNFSSTPTKSDVLGLSKLGKGDNPSFKKGIKNKAVKGMGR